MSATADTPESRRSPDTDNQRLWYFIIGGFVLALASLRPLTQYAWSDVRP